MINLQKERSVANRERMGGQSWKVGRFKFFTYIIDLILFFNLKESLVHSWRIIQIVPIGNAVEVLMDSEPLLPSEFLVFLAIVDLLRSISGLKGSSV